MPVIVRANCIGTLAAKELSSGDSGIVGHVVDTFSNSFYLRSLSGELVFVTNRPLQSPITINLDSTLNLEHVAKPLEPVHFREKEIRMAGDAFIDLSRALSYQAPQTPADELRPEFAEIERALRTIAFLIGIIDTSQSVLDPHGLAHKGMADFISDGVMPLRHLSAESRFREAALKIVGLGSGFTPSGDDALGGFLATYNFLAKTVGRSPILLDFALLQEKTSWVSAKLLDYMQRLILDDQMYRLIHTAAEVDEDGAVLAFETLLPRGHTSGIDISAGTTLALSLVRDVASKKQGTEAIASALGLSR